MAYTKNPKGTRRVDRPGAHGWYMAIRRGERTISEYFADSKWGGKAKAGKAARDRYRELAATLPAQRTSEGVLTQRNSTGIVGVRLIDQGAYADGSTKSAYMATWMEDGHARCMGFSCGRFGQEVAFQLACMAREMHPADREALLRIAAERGLGVRRRR